MEIPRKDHVAFAAIMRALEGFTVEQAYQILMEAADYGIKRRAIIQPLAPAEDSPETT